MKITVEQIMALIPCYDEARVRKLIGDGIAPEAWLDLPIEASDIIWVACRVLPNDVVAQAIEAIVARAVTNHALHCGVAKVEFWAARWLSKKDRSLKSAHLAMYKALFAKSFAYGAADAAKLAAMAFPTRRLKTPWTRQSQELMAHWASCSTVVAAKTAFASHLHGQQTISQLNAELQFQIEDFRAALRREVKP